MEHFSCCGTDCSQCGYLGQVCQGCSQSQGRPFYSPDVPCPIYRCAVLERGQAGCGGCNALPCPIWRATRDPQLSDEAFEETIRERVNNLKKAEDSHA